jgi:hypothetical protein
MALRKTATTSHGFVADSAYHRVENLAFQGKDVIKFDVKSYKSPAENVPFSTIDFGCKYDLERSNPFIQAYEHLKTLPEFANSKDC